MACLLIAVMSILRFFPTPANHDVARGVPARAWIGQRLYPSTGGRCAAISPAGQFEAGPDEVNERAVR
jgi:hypothetical protein